MLSTDFCVAGLLEPCQAIEIPQQPLSKLNRVLTLNANTEQNR
jgi:hypothetical protein